MEKTLIHNAQDLERAELLLQNYHRSFFIGFMPRYHRLVKKTNLLGKAYSARFEFGSYLPFWHPWEDYRVSYASKAELGGGVINTISHELDLVQHFLESPKQLSQIQKIYIAEAIFEYNDKIVTLHLDYLQKEYDRNIKILCDEGKIIWNWNENKVILKNYKEQAVELSLPEKFEVNQLYKNELNDFINILHNNQQHHSLNFQHAVFNTELMLLMHQSILEGAKLNFQ